MENPASFGSTEISMSSRSAMDPTCQGYHFHKNDSSSYTWMEIAVEHSAIVILETKHSMQQCSFLPCPISFRSAVCHPRDKDILTQPQENSAKRRLEPRKVCL